jgi:hypothetical protein
MKKRKPFSLARRNVFKQKKSPWCLYIKLNGDDDFCKRIFFGASYGGSAKAKALPKLQGFLYEMEEPRKCFAVEALLRRVSQNGQNDHYAPEYILRERYRFRTALLATHRPAAVFKQKKRF